MNRLFSLFLFLGCFSVFSQISDNFNDGNFTLSPAWSGSNSNFIVNSSKQLQSTSTVAGTSYLSTNHSLTSIDFKEWKFWIKMAFSPSTSNYSKVYLTAVNSNLSTNPDGYYLQFGESGTADKVRLMKRENSVTSEICSGLAAQISKSFAIGVRVLRDNVGNWKLFIDPLGGEDFNSYALGTDTSSIIGSSFGIFCKYSLSNASKFYWDNFEIKEEVKDLSPPILISANVVSPNRVDLHFDQSLEIISAESIINYSLSPNIEIDSAKLDSLNNSIIHLVLKSDLINGQNYSVQTTNITDNFGNISVIQTAIFSFLVTETPILGDVIITEFMADPSPVIGLPEIEYIEIFNSSNKYFDLQDWKIGDATGDGTLDSKWLYPGEYLILCSTSAINEFPKCVGVTSFPSLNNSGDEIVLKFSNDLIIDKLEYNDGWYKNDIKKEGGYSLERINLNLPCSNVTNWIASISSIGGTPSKINSVNDSTVDLSPPLISYIQTSAPNHLKIYFNEGMDSTSLSKSFISTTPALVIKNKTIASLFPMYLSLDFNENFIGSQEYSIQLNSVADCSNNITNLKDRFVIAEQPIRGDIVINEILFDPLTGGSDFIELYNNSSKWIDLKGVNLANYEKGVVSNLKIISNNYNLKAGEYIVLTADSLFQQQNYDYSSSGKYLQQTLPNYNIDSGTVYLTFEETILDKVAYTEDWQFKLLDATKGKSLERIDPNGISNSSLNWHTAAESIGFATPGKINSQKLTSKATGDFSFISKTISPDNDGFEDLLEIHYRLLQPDMVGSFSIYDNNGQLIQTVFKNNLLATEGIFTWDGITDSNLKASIGTYVGVFEAFDTKGGIIINKSKAFVVAGKI